MRLAPLARSVAWVLVPVASVAAQGSVWTVDDGPHSYGGGWIFDLNADGTIDSLAELPVPDPVSDFDGFASGLTAIGDLNGDGTPDLVAGAPGDDRSGRNRGAVWLLLRAPDGSLAARIPLRPGRNFVGTEPGFDWVPKDVSFGECVASLGDLDGDGSVELAVGASAPEPTKGRVWLLSLAPDGSVVEEGTISQGSGGFTGVLQDGDRFGSALANIGDLDGDGITDLAVGASGDGFAGAVWICFLDSDRTVASSQKIGHGTGGFSGSLSSGDSFGSSIAAIGDLDGDGVTELAVGATGDDDGGGDSGAVWILFLEADGTVSAQQLISKTQGGLGSHNGRHFGASVAPLGDLDEDGIPDLAVGASTDLAGTGTGAVFVLFLNADGTVKSRRRLTSEFTGVAGGDMLGAALANLGDLDGDGRPDLAVGAALRDGAPTVPDYTSLEDAFAAAASGDTVLVRGGSYPLGGPFCFGPEIYSKSLTIQAWNPFNARVLGGLAMRNLGPSQSARISGLVFRFCAGLGAGGLSFSDCAGAIWLEDLEFEGATEPGAHASAPAVFVDDCPRVVLNRCDIEGFMGLPGLWVSGGSSVYAYDSAFRGGWDCTEVSYMYFSEPGAPAIRSTSPDDLLFLSGCTLTGGEGSFCNGCEDGGHALDVAGTVVFHDGELEPGVGCPPGLESTGPVEHLNGLALRMYVNNPTRENEQTLFTFQGPPNVPVSVRFSLASGALFRPRQNGVDVLGVPRFEQFLGFTDGDGVLRSTQHLGALPPGYEILHLFAQAYYVGPFTPQAPVGPKTTVLPNPPTRIQLGAAIRLSRLDGNL